MRTVLWWIGWILLTILSFFVSCYFWTKFIAQHVGNMRQPGVPVLWVSAVFGTWMALLVPLIIVMYVKVDKAYEDARLAREARAAKNVPSSTLYKKIFVEESKRALPKELSKKLKNVPETIRGGHLVTAVLRNGGKVENIFIYDRKEVLGLYGAERLSFEIGDIIDLVPVLSQKIPDFQTERWLRLDG